MPCTVTCHVRSGPRQADLWRGHLRFSRKFTGLSARAAFAAGLVSLAGVVAATCVLQVNSASGTPYLPPGDWLPTWRVSIVASFMAYAVAVLLLAVVGSVGRWKQAFALAVAIQGVPLATPLVLSGDVNAYAGFARSPHPYGAGQSSMGRFGRPFRGWSSSWATPLSFFGWWRLRRSSRSRRWSQGSLGVKHWQPRLSVGTRSSRSISATADTTTP